MFGISKGTIHRLIKKNVIRSMNLGESRVKSYEKLQYNADLVNKRIKKYPKGADKFLRFKEGYETK